MDARFLRPDLARDFAQRLLSQSPLDRGTDLFLAAPRRTGKSSFLVQELRPALEQAGAVVVYCDLWERQTEDPAIVVVEAVRRALAQTDPPTKRLVRAARETTGVSKASAGGLGLEVDKIDEDHSVVSALRALVDRLDKEMAYRPVVLMVDEAQYATPTKKGRALMFALKSARDQLNRRADAPMFFLILTGSNQAKLSALIVKRNAPFYGGRVQRFPALGDDFVRWFVESVNGSLLPARRIAIKDAQAAFLEVGARPEPFMAVIREHALDPEPTCTPLRMRARQANQDEWAEFDDKFREMTPLQRAVLIAMIGGKTSRFFDQAAQDSYRSFLPPGADVSASAA